MIRIFAWRHIKFQLSNHAVTTTTLSMPIRSLATPAGQKFFEIMLEYKKHNYGQTIPSRFIKDMRKATDTDGDNEITMEELRKMLKNIGAEGKITEEELKTIFDDMGVEKTGGERVIPVDDMIKSWNEHTKVG